MNGVDSGGWCTVDEVLSALDDFVDSNLSSFAHWAFRLQVGPIRHSQSAVHSGHQHVHLLLIFLLGCKHVGIE